MTRTVFGGEITFKGFPTETGSGSAFIVDGGLAITTACTDKQGAWEFVRTFLTEDWQRMFTLSLTINSVVFESNLAMEVSNRSDMWMGGPAGGMIHIPNLTECEEEQLMALINSIDQVISQDTALWNIVWEGASGFFHSQRTLQDAIRIIQSRAAIYMSEQAG